MFRLKAPDGTVVAVSGRYSDKASAVDGINVVRECAGTGLIKDLCPVASPDEGVPEEPSPSPAAAAGNKQSDPRTSARCAWTQRGLSVRCHADSRLLVLSWETLVAPGGDTPALRNTMRLDAVDFPSSAATKPRSPVCCTRISQVPSERIINTSGAAVLQLPGNGSIRRPRPWNAPLPGRW
ncbi:YegP family protein [Pseudarthrobacter sp. MDT1-22]